MRRTSWLLLVAMVVAVALALSSQGSPTVAQEARQRDIIVIRCNVTATGFKLVGYEASTSAPTQRTENCPETISRLLRDNFVLHDIGYFDMDSDFMVYTLSR
jgi:hypothetical protein